MAETFQIGHGEAKLYGMLYSILYIPETIEKENTYFGKKIFKKKKYYCSKK